MAKKKSWFQTGSEGETKSKTVDAQQKAKREAGGGQRFWLKPDTSAKCTFLDNPQFFLFEHNMKLNGKYFNFFTCIQEFDTCPLCEDGDTPSYILVCTVINHQKYTGEDGKEYKNQKQLFVAKGKARQLLLRRIEKRGGDLTHCVFEMSRGSGKTECGTGEDFEYLGKLSLAKLKPMLPEGADKDWLKPYDYEKIFQPQSAEDLRLITGGEAPVGGGSDDLDLDGDDLGVGEGDDDNLSIDDLL